MVEALLGLLGPLAYPECRRTTRRWYLFWLRMVPATLAALALALIFAIGEFRSIIDPGHHLDDDVRIALGVVLGGGMAATVILVPSLLAGSLAGEKERGSIALLLSTEAGVRDIVLSRWAGGLAGLGLMMATIAPFVVGLLALGSYPASTWLAIIALLVALGGGGGGLALAVSVLSRRGRDALLLIYLLDVVALIGSAFVDRRPGGASGWLVLALNPFGVLGPLVEEGEAGPALGVAAGWAVLGAVGLGVACWRLRPSCLVDPNRRPGRSRRGAGRRVPSVGERPMLWKELHIDRAGSLGRVGRWVGALVAAWLGLGSAVLAALAVAGGAGTGTDPEWAIATLGSAYGMTVVAISFLIQGSIGLRSAAMVAGERERGTWDGLLTSPLTPAEIVVGKFGGSWFALRWLIGSALVAWTLTALLGGMTPYRYALTLAETLVWGTLMAGFGLAMSLRMATATRAMAATVGGWCVAFVACKIVATIATSLALILPLFYFQVIPPARVGSWYAIGNDWGSLLLAALIAALVLLDTFARFDRIAGRVAGGVTAEAIDRLIHGRPMAPVRLDGARPSSVER